MRNLKKKSNGSKIIGITILVVLLLVGVKQFFLQPARKLQLFYRNGSVIPTPTPVEKPAVTIFLKNTATNTQTQWLIKQLEQMAGITKVTYTSQQEVYKQYIQENKGNPELVSLATPDIFPEKIDVYTKSPSLVDQINAFAQSQPFVGQVLESLLFLTPTP